MENKESRGERGERREEKEGYRRVMVFGWVGLGWVELVRLVLVSQMPIFKAYYIRTS